MNKYILDTDTLSEFIRGNKKVTQNVAAYIGKEQMNLSVITYYEILSGFFYRDARNQLTRFEELVSINKILQLNTRAAKIAAGIEADLRKKGTVIGHTDTLIAGIAMANDLQLVTNNTDHFKRIKGLEITNWVK
jgi:tRNA(fMet)-specific endonuclease VapC